MQIDTQLISLQETWEKGLKIVQLSVLWVASNWMSLVSLTCSPVCGQHKHSWRCPKISLKMSGGGMLTNGVSTWGHCLSSLSWYDMQPMTQTDVNVPVVFKKDNCKRAILLTGLICCFHPLSSFFTLEESPLIQVFVLFPFCWYYMNQLLRKPK